ncbi:hypothetical protein COOONC_28005 [Cooperia oncophora]
MYAHLSRVSSRPRSTKNDSKEYGLWRYSTNKLPDVMLAKAVSYQSYPTGILHRSTDIGQKEQTLNCGNANSRKADAMKSTSTRQLRSPAQAARSKDNYYRFRSKHSVLLFSIRAAERIEIVRQEPDCCFTACPEPSAAKTANPELGSIMRFKRRKSHCRSASLEASSSVIPTISRLRINYEETIKEMHLNRASRKSVSISNDSSHAQDHLRTIPSERKSAIAEPGIQNPSSFAPLPKSSSKISLNAVTESWLFNPAIESGKNVHWLYLDYAHSVRTSQRDLESTSPLQPLNGTTI